MDRANYGVKDANLVQTAALPNGATSTTITGFNIGLLSARGARLAACEILISAPALNTSQLPDSQTMTYSLESDDNSGFTGAKIVADKVLVQTGAGGAGAAAASARIKIPTDCAQYIRIKATNSGAGDASGVSMTISVCM